MIWMLRLYPRRWRIRYGEEVAALVAGERPSFRLFVDLLAGAVDARLNPQTTPDTTTQGEPRQMTTVERLCAASRRDRAYNGPLMIGSSLVFVTIALILHLGFDQVLVGQTLLYSAFPLSLILAGEHRYLERWPRPVRWIVLGASMAAMFAFLLAVTLVAARF
jgi:hypothetical protein